MKGILLRALLVAALAVSTQAQARPDLIVSGVELQLDAQGFVSKVTVSVANVCREHARASYVLVTFKESAEQSAKTIMFIGNTVPPFRSTGSFSQSFPITKMKIGSGRHIVVEVDPYRKVVETNEDNNWWKLNPNSKPQPAGRQYQCSAKM